MEAAMGKSYFAILGVGSDATEKEIRAAYRKRAKEFHPDRFHGGDEPFRQIQKAYHALKDTRRREAHRRQVEETPDVSRPAPPPGFPGPEPLIPDRRGIYSQKTQIRRSAPPFHSPLDDLFDWVDEIFKSRLI
jgi:curved DNA-binding protein CbpA